jgi:hypothetical protein
VRDPKRSRTAALLAALALSGAAFAVTGCGGGLTLTPAATRLEREDFIAVCRALLSERAAVNGEVAATRAAWPLVADGLPAAIGSLPRRPIQAAGAQAARLALPALLRERTAASLTGPSSQLGGLLRTFYGLAARGWQMIGAAIAQIEHGTPLGARFARANVALYIDSVYDAHFSLAQLGKKVTAGYEKLGGASAFGKSLTQAEVDALARAYSEASDRLHPHAGVRLGS